MSELTTTGVNRIDNVMFKSSQIKQLQSDARKLAVKDAKAKAEDFAAGLGQKVNGRYGVRQFTRIRTATSDDV
jgi:uncharacterized protein YggE